MPDGRSTNKGRPPKPISKEQILLAMKNTLSNRAAARYLGFSYIHYKGWAKKYTDEATGKSLFELHKNQSGKGIPKFLTGNNAKFDFDIKDVIEGRISAKHFKPEKIKRRMIEEGYLKEECAICGFCERRVNDYKIPLILNFKDGNTNYYNLGNIRLLCYNCFFINVGDVFNKNDVFQLETHEPVNKTSNAVDLELDEYQKSQLENLGLIDPPKSDEDDASNLISRL